MALGLATVTPTPALAAPSTDELVQMLRVVDDRQENNGDFKSLVYLEQKESGKADLVYQVAVYRRDLDDKLVMLFLMPKEQAGQGYLRVDNNLFFYDPSVGKWERRTERERIGGTDSNRQDFDQSRLHEEYRPTFVAEEKLGSYTVNHLLLTATTEADVAYPVVHLWVDKATGNVLKRQDLALSGKLMRTSLYPKWEKVYSQTKQADVYYAREIRIFDEIEKGNQTTIVIQSLDLSALDDSIFTKAWLESKSR
ncbi:MAG: outer membrane lipoprotein-sorting protein [Myxococcales bacterium]|nr:outer membrane lipoprotein-sorting protein [Myxococcales bacterium]